MNFSFEKGNTSEKVYKSEQPISKENIDENILNFLYEHADNNVDLLRVSDFSLEFLIFKGNKGFFKFNIESGNGGNSEIMLTGQDLEDVIKVIQEHGAGFDINLN